MSPFCNYFGYNITWFILTVYALYTVLLYKLKFVHVMKSLANGVIDRSGYDRTMRSFKDRRLFLLFLTFFEISFFIWWFNGKIPQELDIQGLFIAIAVLPIGAEIFSAFLATALLPFTLRRRITVNVRSYDRHGGLKPVSDLLIVFVFLYFVGITVAFILYPPFISHPVFGSIFVAIGVGIFFMPQLLLHQTLVGVKHDELSNVQSLIDDLERKILAIKVHDIGNQAENREMYESYLSSYRTIREEINSMSTWPFDLNGLYKLLLGSIIPAIPLPFVLTDYNQYFPKQGENLWQWIITILVHVPSVPPDIFSPLLCRVP